MKSIKQMNKRGQMFEQMSGLAVAIAGLAIALVVTFLVISQSRSTMSDAEKCATSGWSHNGTVCCLDGATPCAGTNQSTAFSASFNATNTLGSAVDEIPGWVSLIVIAVIGSIILGLVAMFRNR